MNNRGMATIEACIIVPICIGITMLLMWLGIYYYNCNIVSQSIAQAIAYGSEQEYMDNDVIKNLVKDKLYERLKRELILIKDVQCEIDVSYGKISAKAEGNMNVPKAFAFGGIYKGSEWKMSSKSTAPRLNHSLLMRLTHK